MENLQRIFLFASMICAGAAFLFAAFWTILFFFTGVATFAGPDQSGLWVFSLFYFVFAAAGACAFGLVTRHIWNRLKRLDSQTR